MQSKTTRAFRTISEAGEELDLQPHVLRFWESKFSQIKPIKRGGGRRFYRPEDIEFLRGIKILLHDEGHPIKDVQKLIRLKGPGRVMELGQSVEKAARERDVKDTVLVPERIQKTRPPKSKAETKAENPGQETMTPSQEDVSGITDSTGQSSSDSTQLPIQKSSDRPNTLPSGQELTEGERLQYRNDLEEALKRLSELKLRWAKFRVATTNE